MATLIDKVLAKTSPPPNSEPIPVPPDVKKRLERGRTRMRRDANKRTECLEFWRGNQFVYVNKDNYLVKQGVVIGASGKPGYRIRRSWNIIFGIVEAKVSAATQRVPSYEVDPSTIDPTAESAARLAAKVARYGYDKWRVRKATTDVVTMALVTGEGFAMPYFDSSVPPYIDRAKGIGQGEIKIKTFGPNECYWEPGVNFEDSTWHVIEQARNIDEVYRIPGYIGKTLTPDADKVTVLGDSQAVSGQHNLVLVSEYLERPSPRYELGRRMIFANDRLVVPADTYPCATYEGFDGPVLHRLSYTRDPSSDRDSGLVKHMIDPQRAFNACNNKALEWIQMALAPQVVVQPGVLGRQKVTDAPGVVYEVPDPKNNFVWRDVPPVPQELRMMKNDAQEAMHEISAYRDFPSSVNAAKAIQSIIESDSSRWQVFMGNLAEYHSHLMRHMLVLVQKHYTEPRLLKIRGAYGPESIKDFRGADLHDQCDVTVLPGSLEPRTAQNMQQQIMQYAQMGWVTPQAAMAAINGGTAESLIESYELDIARANLVIQKIKQGLQVLFSAPPRVDENGQDIPGWMPREFDSIPIQMEVLSNWMKTSEYDSLPPEQQHAADLYYQGLKHLKAQKEAEQAQAQQQMAESLGMGNAAKPQGPSALPSTPGPSPSGAPPPPASALPDGPKPAPNHQPGGPQG